MSASRHFSCMSALSEARATKERVLHLREGADYVFSHRVRTIIFETLCLICRISFVNMMALVHALAKVSMVNSDLISLFRNFHHPIWRNGVL
jgi:hypothetical protein